MMKYDAEGVNKNTVQAYMNFSAQTHDQNSASKWHASWFADEQGSW